MTTQVTVTGYSWDAFSHLPRHSERVEIHGMTLRAALDKLREVDYGNLGGMHDVELSDGTWLEIGCAPAAEKGMSQMSSQRITRYEYDGYSDWPVVVRRYSL